MRTFFQGIPDSLEESAVIDGANSFTIFFRIIIPLSMPVIAVMTLYYGVFHWNSWFQAMIFLRDRALYPLQLFLREILIQQQMREILGELEQMEDQVMNVNRDILEAAFIIISTVPILALYPFLQRYFIKGVMIGALKG
jgi:putative aldouronate transport system permease protein